MPTTTRRPYRFLLAILIALGIVGSTALLARAHEPIEFTHKPGVATFHNPNDQAVEINYGTANSGDVQHVTVPAGETVTVVAAHQNFGYTATIDGVEVGYLGWPGVDLSAAEAEHTNPVTAKFGDGYVIFANDNPHPAVVTWGAYGTEEANVVNIPANDSVNVKLVMEGHLIWTAEVNNVPAGGNLGTRGEDLSQYTTKEPTATQTKKPVRPSLPHTGN